MSNVYFNGHVKTVSFSDVRKVLKAQSDPKTVHDVIANTIFEKEQK